MGPKKQSIHQAHPDTWEHELEGGWRVLAGRTDRDNEILSLELARANDWWFHVKGMPGSHVLLQTRGREPDRRTLNAAASVAAYYSKARTGGVVAVSGTLAKYVSKPRGAPPGTVEIRRDRVFKVRPGLPSDSASR